MGDYGQTSWNFTFFDTGKRNSIIPVFLSQLKHLWLPIMLVLILVQYLAGDRR